MTLTIRNPWLIVIALGLALACGSDGGGSEADTAATGGTSASTGGAAASTGGTTAATGGTTSTGGTTGAGGSTSTGGAEPAGGTGGIDPGTGGATGGSVNVPPDGGGTPEGYPPGPYGREVGDTIENYLFHGYVNPTGEALSNTLPQTDYSLDDARRSGARYALLHLSAFYCPGCQSAAGDLGNLSKPVQDAGGVVIEILFRSGAEGLDAWIERFDLAVTTVSPRAGAPTLDQGDVDRENAYIVDLSTMEIVWTEFGSYGATNNSSAKQGLAEMSRLLGL